MENFDGVGLNYLDYFFLLVVFLTLVTGIIKGFIREAVSLLFLVVGFVVAARSYPILARPMEAAISSSGLRQAIAFIALVLVFVIAGFIVSRLLKKIVHAVKLGLLDRTAGGFFGILKGVFQCLILVFLMTAFGILEEQRHNSLLAPPLTEGGRLISRIVPESARAQFRRGYRRMKEEGRRFKDVLNEHLPEKSDEDR